MKDLVIISYSFYTISIPILNFNLADNNQSNNSETQNCEPASLSPSQIQPEFNFEALNFSHDKKLAISALNHDLKETPEAVTSFKNSQKLYELSEIYSTMKINDTPEEAYDSTIFLVGSNNDHNGFEGIDLPNFLESCLKSSSRPIVAHNQQNSIETLQSYNGHNLKEPTPIKFFVEDQNFRENSEAKFKYQESPEKRPIEQQNHLSIIQKQNEIIKRLTQENVALKETIKKEQKEKFRMVLQFEQLKSKTRQKHKLVDKSTMANFVTIDQVRNYQFIVVI